MKWFSCHFLSFQARDEELKQVQREDRGKVGPGSAVLRSVRGETWEIKKKINPAKTNLNFKAGVTLRIKMIRCVSCGVECDSASVVCFGPCAFMAELGRVPGSHRAPHPGPCSVGHEGEPGNDSGLQTLHCCECAHVKTHTQANSSCNPDTHTQRPLTKKHVRRK